MLTTEMMKRLGLAVLGYSLPETSTLRDLLQDARKGLLATVVMGVLIAAMLLLFCFGFYSFLMSEGVSVGLSLTISLFILSLLTFIAGLMANKHLARLEQTKEKLSPFEGEQSITRLIDADLLLREFLAGFNQTDKHPAPSRDARSKERDWL
ncbi:hypothetical protein [Terasakiella pusilla]|uniref:hypothetical protein n=1 Tax=Terasakiella pusilla TaxID=64973 RepID=UPI003AA997F5